MNKEAIAASLRLFNAVQVDKIDESKKKNLHFVGLDKGYMLSPDLLPASNDLLAIIDDIVGISGAKANAAFHKSWAVVRDSSMEELFLQQMIHYITTYGFEELGIYHESTVYIPNEVLEVPGLTGRIPLTVIKAYTRIDMLNSIVTLGESGFSLHESTLNDIMTVVENSGADESGWVGLIENRELKARLFDYYGIVPTEPVEFLRHVISKLTDESLLIKNTELIDKIKSSNGKFCDELMRQAPDDLASIFLRYKPLFLALRSISRKKAVFNKLRKQAVTMHKPLPEDYLNNVTSMLKNGTLKFNRLSDKLDKATIFRKIRLAYALNYRMNPGNSIVYQVRNGRGWADDFNWNCKALDTEAALGYVFMSIIKDLKKNVEGKKFLIPNGIQYALPATEKQFTGNIPSGSYITVPNDLVIGVHWKNIENVGGWANGRIDLDMALISVTGKIGWDSSYRTVDRNVMFSGDVTDAPGDGASELFYFSGTKLHTPSLITLNYYNYCEDYPVPMKLFAASENIKSMKRNYMVDPNNILFSANVTIDKKANILGLYMPVNGKNRFYFYHTAVGNRITSYADDINTRRTREFLECKMRDPIVLNQLLTMANAEIITEAPDDGSEFVDLSPEALDKTSFIDILVGE